MKKRISARSILTYPNIQSALRWASENELAEKGNRLAFALGKYWEVRGYLFEGSMWLDKFLHDTGNLTPRTVSNSKRLAGVLATILGENEKSILLTKESLSISRELDDKNGVSQCLNVLGLISFDMSNLKEAKEYLTEALSIRRQFGRNIGLCSALNSLGLVLIHEGEFDKSLKYYEEAMEIANELNDDIYKGILYNNLAEVYDYMGNYEKSKEYLELGIEVDKNLGNKNGLGISLYNLAMLAMKNSDNDTAEKLFEECLLIGKETGFKFAVIYSTIGLGQLMIVKKNIDQAAEHFCNVLTEFGKVADAKCIAMSLAGISKVLQIRGMLEESVIIAGAAISRYETYGIYMDKSVEADFENILKPLKALSGTEETNRYIEEGKSLSKADAESRALRYLKMTAVVR
jgi:tetratricopeptide (TPR) repeat protein